MSTHFSKKLLLLTAAGSLLQPVLPAMATLDEIVVVARKREESIMKVPVIASVLSATQLDQYAVNDVKNIADKIPGLNIQSGPAASGVLVSLRGVGTASNNPTIDQSVALAVDGVQFTQGLAFAASSFDMAQVEVLKGPQALFYGKAAPGGVISIRTADPTDEFEVMLRGGYEFEAEEKLGEFVVSGPVSDTLGLRLAAQFTNMEGFFKNAAVPASHPFVGSLGASSAALKDFPEKESMILRGTAVWEPTDTFSARLKVNYADVDIQGYGGNSEFGACPEGNSSGAVANVFPGIFSGLEFIGSDDCVLDGTYYYVAQDPAEYPDIWNNGVPFQAYETTFGSLELNHDIGENLTLTSVTGFYHVDMQAMMAGGATTTVGSPFALQSDLRRTDITQEFRLASDFDGPLNYMLGAFYHDGKTRHLNLLPFNQTFALFGGPPIIPYGGYVEHEVSVEAISLFGQMLWDIRPDLELGVGARWTEEDREHKAFSIFDRSLGFRNVFVDLAKPSIGSSNWSPEVSLTYTPNDDLTLFANLKQAYKSGSFDTGGTVNDDEDVSFGDERVRGGEVGLKSRLLDGNLAVNAAVYYYKYKDLQLEASEFDLSTPGGTIGTRTTNAAEAKTYGVDFDITYTPPAIEGLTLFSAVNYNKGEYIKFGNAKCYYGQTQALGCDIFQDADLVADAQDLAGEPLLRAPEWSANFGFDYERAVLNDMTLQFGTNTSYTSSYQTNTENAFYTIQDSHFKVGATLSLSGPNDGWTAEIIGNNLNDEIVAGKCTVRGFADSLLFTSFGNQTGDPTTNFGGLGESLCNTERGRSVWLRLTLRPTALWNN